MLCSYCSLLSSNVQHIVNSLVAQTRASLQQSCRTLAPGNMFFCAKCGARTECRPVRNKGVLDIISTRRALIGSRGQWRGSCHGHKCRTTQSPFSLALLHSRSSVLSCLWRARVSPVSSALLFVWFIYLSSRGLSCKCSCWPPILVVLRSLPKSNKQSFVFFSLRCRCACFVGNLLWVFLSLFLPQIPRVLICSPTSPLRLSLNPPSQVD